MLNNKWWGKLHAEKAKNDQNGLMSQMSNLAIRQMDQIGQMSRQLIESHVNWVVRFIKKGQISQ